MGDWVDVQIGCYDVDVMTNTKTEGLGTLSIFTTDLVLSLTAATGVV
jgi:hypothetical protein